MVVTLENPPENLRPGLSTTAKIKTAERKDVIGIPIQALAVRSRKDLEDAAKEREERRKCDVGRTAAGSRRRSKKGRSARRLRGERKEGVFRPVETGISGVTDIEITKGLQAGDEIVVGSYKALRTLKPEASVKVDNSAPKKTDDSQ